MDGLSGVMQHARGIGCSDVDSDRLYSRHSDVLWRRTLDGVILLPPQAASATHITSPGELIWATLESPVTLNQICAIVGEHFAVPAASVANDVRTLLNDLDRIQALRTFDRGVDPPF